MNRRRGSNDGHRPFITGAGALSFKIAGDVRDGAGFEALAKASSRPIVVTRSEGSFRRPRCKPRRAARRLDNFSRAVRRIDGTALRGFWGRGFRWFNLTGPGLPKAGC